MPLPCRVALKSDERSDDLPVLRLDLIERLAGGEGLIITGDVMPNPLVSFEHPDWKFGFDADPNLAIETRKKMVDQAAADKTRLLGYHWPYPGVGFADKKDTAYVFVKA